MAVISRQAVVAYSCEQMYALVSDIAAYDSFLPWCAKSMVAADDGEQVRATLCLRYKGIDLSFTTLNRNTPPRSIDMTLFEGPFKHLGGRWLFTPLSDDGCKVEFELDFDFSSLVYASLFKPVLDRAMSSLLDAFIERAHKVYG